MAKHVELAFSTVRRIRQDRGLVLRRFPESMVSDDHDINDMPRGIAGLFRNPPANAISKSVASYEAAISRFIEVSGSNAVRPFVWAANPERIVDSKKERA